MRPAAVRALVGLTLVAIIVLLAAIARRQRHAHPRGAGHCSLVDGGTCRVACDYREGDRLYARILIPGLSDVQIATTVRARGLDGGEIRVESEHGAALARCEGLTSVEFFSR